jgi:phospholipid/cholesterol/gamma-HCH transport system ATP-binding protein
MSSDHLPRCSTNVRSTGGPMSEEFCTVTSETMTSKIGLENIDLYFGSKVVFKDLHLTINTGECLVLLGPSGQGKSSLLKILAGLVKPDRGRVTVDGCDLTPSLKTGMLFQKNALFDSMTVLENILFPLEEATNLSALERNEIADQLLTDVGLLHSRDLYPHEISGGMQKRLGIARALALKPEIVLYDDPTAGLDPITSRRIAQLLKDFSSSQKVTSVVVTNDLMRALQLGDQLAFVWNHTVTLVGTPEQAMSSQSEPFRSFIRGIQFA